jgi:PPK2 family polyphosphate:nucleotide phosphotransferase
MRLAKRLRVSAGPVDLAAYPTDATPGFSGGKAAGRRALAELGPDLLDLQTRLYAQRETPGARRVLLVLQGMDTSGKGGVLKHTVGLVDPVGLRITSFKAPTAEERAHDFLWRVERAVPEPGYLGVFDRSHYEDVLIQRVHAFAPPAEIARRYDAINAFEQRLVDAGTVVVKCMLHISPAEQRRRLLARLDDPAKNWKFSPSDLVERGKWRAYRAAYTDTIAATSQPHAPWYVVPADHKWFAEALVTAVVVEALEGLNLAVPSLSPERRRELRIARRRLAGRR